MKGALLAARLAALGALAISLAQGGCGSGEVFFPTGGGGAGADGGGAQGGGGGTTQGGGGTTSQGGGGSSQGGGGSGGTGGTTTSSTTGQCSVDSDCDAALGPAACGKWTCSAGACSASSPGCTDADHDGYGAGAACACAGLDCDDGDKTIAGTASQSCYSGPAGTETLGTCHPGVTSCTGGVWSPCGGEVVPSGEACNTQDDDCDGTPDDGLGTFTCGLGACQKTVSACNNGLTGSCIPGAPPSATDGPTCNGMDDDCDGAIDEDCKSCVAVTSGSVSVSPDGTFLNPFATVQAAIDWAVAHPAGPQTVCVAAGATCGQTGTYKTPNGATITMANGVSVLGNYESATWNRCNNSITILQPQTAEGVTFPPAVQNTTVLDGFRIERFNTGASGTTAGVTVNGAKSVILSGLSVTVSPTVANSYGVNAIAGADLTITKSAIGAGLGSVESIAVRSIGSKVAIKDNCTQFDNTGRCNSFCFSGVNQVPSIAARTPFGSGTTYGVLLQDSPGSLIETTALCRAEAETAALVRIAGDGTGILIRANNINSFGGSLQAHGIWMEDCNDAAPWIVDNTSIAANGTNQSTVVNAVRAIGTCHPVIDNNVQIVGGGEGASSNPIGVYCGKNLQNAPSECVILGNGRIAGSQVGFPMSAIGVRCDDGACNRIAGNRLITGRGGSPDSVGLWLGSTGTSVENNLIRGGCSPKSTGVRAEDSYARLENNRIFGFDPADCGAASANLQESIGLRILLHAGAHELDIHSNDIDGLGLASNATCLSRGVTFELDPLSGPAALGILRNNILRAGVCPMSHINLVENVAGADPRILENNDFDPAGPPTGLYRDESLTLVTTIAEVNALADLTVSANISVDPLFMNYPSDIHLQPTSLCIGAGTPIGSPATDFEGTPRDPLNPDIGADEN